MVKRSRAEFLLQNLPQLQNLIKRDSQSYQEEFSQQWRHYESQLSIFKLNPSAESAEFGELITFLSHVAHCYPKECETFPQQLVDLLSNQYQILDSDLRKTMVQALVLMRNKDLISPTSLLSLFFTLFRCKDKILRQLLHNHIVADIKSANMKAKNNKLNKTLQNFMYTMLKDSSDANVMIDLYKKNIWNDSKTVNLIAEACFSAIPKIAATSIQFFLNSNEKKEEEDEDENLPDVTNIKHQMSINKKTKARRNQLEKAMSSIKRKERNKQKAEVFNFSALHLLNDPQGLAEKLFSRLRQVTSNNSFKFELRLQMMNLISRLIGVHKLILLNFYEYLIPYLKAHQKEVTAIIAYAAQASHELVPPDSMETVVQAIADNFVWSNCASEVITAGLNGLREICIRCPLAMPEQLLQSLMDDFKNHREKGPNNAARSLLGLYREINPEMLKKKDRGKSASINMKSFKATQYGHVSVTTGIAGADLLENESADDENYSSEGENSDSNAEDDLLEEIPEDEEVDLDDFEIDSNPEEDESDDEEEDEEEEEEEEEEAADQEASDPQLESSPEKKPKLGLSAERIFTDEDFKKMRELKLKRDAEIMTGKKSTANEIQDDSDEEKDHDVVDVSQIMSGIKRKDDYKARMESIKAGREGRSFGSRKGNEERSSLTNKVKSKKNKAFMMIVHKRDVKNKSKRSLRDKQKLLRQHIKKQKMKK